MRERPGEGIPKSAAPAFAVCVIVIDNDLKPCKIVIMNDYRILALQNPWWQRQEAIADGNHVQGHGKRFPCQAEGLKGHHRAAGRRVDHSHSSLRACGLE